MLVSQRRQVVVSIGDEALRARVLGTIDGVRAVVRTEDDLWDALVAGFEATVVLVGLRTPWAVVERTDLEELRWQCPLAHVIVCLDATDAAGGQLPQLAASGADMFLLVGEEEADRQLKGEVGQCLDGGLPDALAPLLRHREWTRDAAIESWCARMGYQPLCVARRSDGNRRSIAGHFRIAPRTVYQAARRLGWKDAVGLMSGARLLHVARELMRAPSMPVARLAARLKFPSRASLHEFVHDSLDLSMGELRAEPLQTALRYWRTRGLG